jgi:hypothetical protein
LTLGKGCICRVSADRHSANKIFFWLAERSWRTVRQDLSGSASRTYHFSSIQLSLRGPIVLCPWEAVQNPLYLLDEAPLSLFIHITQLAPLTLSSFPTDNTPHCPPLSVEPRIRFLRKVHGEGAPPQAARTFSPRFQSFGSTSIHPRARTRYMQSSIDLSTRCIS